MLKSSFWIFANFYAVWDFTKAGLLGERVPLAFIYPLPKLYIYSTVLENTVNFQ